MITNMYMYEEYMKLNLIKYQEHYAKPIQSHINGKISNCPIVFNSKFLRKKIYSFLGKYTMVEVYKYKKKKNKKDISDYCAISKKKIVNIVSQMNIILGGDKLTQNGRKKDYLKLIGNDPNLENGKTEWITNAGKIRKLCPCKLNVPKIFLDCLWVKDAPLWHSNPYFEWLRNKSAYILYNIKDKYYIKIIRFCNNYILVANDDDISYEMTYDTLFSIENNNLYDMKFIENYYVFDKYCEKINFFDKYNGIKNTMFFIKKNKSNNQINKKKIIIDYFKDYSKECPVTFKYPIYHLRNILIKKYNKKLIEHDRIYYPAKINIKTYKKISKYKMKIFIRANKIIKKIDSCDDNLIKKGLLKNKFFK